MLPREHPPAPSGPCQGLLGPMGIELMAEIPLKKLTPSNAAACGKLHNFAVELVDGALLALDHVNEVGDTVGMKPQLLHLAGKRCDQLPQARSVPLRKLSTPSGRIDALSAQSGDFARDRRCALKA